MNPEPCSPETSKAPPGCPPDKGVPFAKGEEGQGGEDAVQMTASLCLDSKPAEPDS